MATLKVSGEIRVPGDKSISHRALMFSALAEGTSRIRGILQSADVHSTAGVLRTLGVAIPELSGDFKVRGVGLQGLRQPGTDLDCGNSGTTTRLMAGIVAAHPITARFVGDASLSRRPMRRIAEPLTAMGARFDLSAGDGLPMTLHGGKLQGIIWRTQAASAQIKSAILLAGLCARVPVTVEEPEKSRDHTEQMLGKIVKVQGNKVSLKPVDSIPSLDIDVPSDPSSAAFFAGLAALASEGEIVLPNVALNETRTGFFKILKRMGGNIKFEDVSNKVGTVIASASKLHGVKIGGKEIPAAIDELPLLACIASRVYGETVIKDAQELRVKESDRISAVVNNLRALGADAQELPDGMRIVGSDKPLKGTVTTHADHRIAMAFGILGAIPGNDIKIDDPECVSVSYPGFWNDLKTATK